MKILLTGHQGYIGTQLFKVLSKKHTVIGLDKSTPGGNLLYCNFPNDIDLVIHLAGYSGVRDSLEDPATYWFNNVEASRRLFEKYKNTRIIYASSSSAYEPDLNPYAASKFLLEELAARHPNNIGLRIHTVFSSTPRKGMFFEKLLTGTLEYTTTHYRDFIHLGDVCNIIEIIVNKSHLTGIVDIGTGIPIKISTLAPHLPVKLNAPGERTFTCADMSFLQSINYKPKYTIEKFLTIKDLDNTIIEIHGEIL